MGKLTVECDIGKVSDGYHTFDLDLCRDCDHQFSGR